MATSPPPQLAKLLDQYRAALADIEKLTSSSTFNAAFDRAQQYLDRPHNLPRFTDIDPDLPLEEHMQLFDQVALQQDVAFANQRAILDDLMDSTQQLFAARQKASLVAGQIADLLLQAYPAKSA